MGKNEKIDLLLNEWEKEFPDQFIRDGIINEELYLKAEKKILFIAKEPNAGNHKKEIAKDFRNWWQEPKLEKAFSKTLDLWAYGLLNNFPQNINPRQNSLSQVAFINVKKNCGGAETSREQMLNAIANNSTYVKKQIKLIQPDTIITCFSADHSLVKKLFDIELEEALYGIQIGKLGHAKLISFYHPSMRAPSEMSYVLLKEIINSAKYKEV
jgi:hypothetical protein